MFSVNHLFDKNVFMKDIYPPCYFQYLSRVNLINQITNDSYSVVFDNNYKVLEAKYTYRTLFVTHCSWLPQSAFNTTMPLEVNKKYIRYINKSGTFNILPQHTRQKTSCYCNTNNNIDFN